MNMSRPRQTTYLKQVWYTLTYCNICTANMLALTKRPSTILTHSPHNMIRSKNARHIWACHFSQDRPKSVATLHGMTAHYILQGKAIMCHRQRLCTSLQPRQAVLLHASSMQLKGTQPNGWPDMQEAFSHCRQYRYKSGRDAADA